MGVFVELNDLPKFSVPRMDLTLCSDIDDLRDVLGGSRDIRYATLIKIEMSVEDVIYEIFERMHDNL